MPQVQTMRGPIDVDEMGPTLMHEHVFVLTTEFVQNYGEGAWADDDEQVANVLDKLLTPCRPRATEIIALLMSLALVATSRGCSGSLLDRPETSSSRSRARDTDGDRPFPYTERGNLNTRPPATSRWSSTSCGN